MALDQHSHARSNLKACDTSAKVKQAFSFLAFTAQPPRSFQHGVDAVGRGRSPAPLIYSDSIGESGTDTPLDGTSGCAPLTHCAGLLSTSAGNCKFRGNVNFDLSRVRESANQRCFSEYLQKSNVSIKRYLCEINTALSFLASFNAELRRDALLRPLRESATCRPVGGEFRSGHIVRSCKATTIDRTTMQP